MILFIISLFANKIVGLELIIVVQICYYSLIQIPVLNPCFNALSSMSIITGFSYSMLSKSKDYLIDSYSSQQIKGLSLHSRFLDNYNFTSALIVLPFVISFILFTLANTLHRNNKNRHK